MYVQSSWCVVSWKRTPWTSQAGVGNGKRDLVFFLIAVYSPARLWWTVPLRYPCSSPRYSRDPGGQKEPTGLLVRASPPSSSTLTAKHKAALLGPVLNSANCLMQRGKVRTKSVWSWAAWLVNSLGDCWHSWHTCEICVETVLSQWSHCLPWKTLFVKERATHEESQPASHLLSKKDRQHTSCNAVALWPVTSLHMIICSSRMTWKVERIGLQSNTDTYQKNTKTSNFTCSCCRYRICQQFHLLFSFSSCIRALSVYFWAFSK